MMQNSQAPHIYISLKKQQMLVRFPGRPSRLYGVSTAKAGMNCELDSGGTPIGRHRVKAKFGDGKPLGTIFKGREAVGLWHPGDSLENNLILTRILWLEGCETGLNRGGSVDTEGRYIYIHGTNQEEAIGKTPVSAGCVLMKNADIAELYDLIPIGTDVTIEE